MLKIQRVMDETELPVTVGLRLSENSEESLGEVSSRKSRRGSYRDEGTPGSWIPFDCICR